MVDQGLSRDAAHARLTLRARASRAARLAAWLLLPALASHQPALAQSELARIRGAGVLKVAVYKDMYPFSDQSGGIDVDIAQALAERLGVRVSLLPFDAGDNMGDDFRNMVWKGHYLGYGPADVLMHVPVEPALQARSDQVRIFGAYHREAIRIAIDAQRIDPWPGLEVFEQQPIAVDAGSVSAQLMLAADQGRYREHVLIEHGIHGALDALKGGRAAAIMATRSEIEAGLGGSPRYQVVDPGLPALPARGWLVGMAVRRGADDLAQQLQLALDALRDDGSLARIFAQHGVALHQP